MSTPEFLVGAATDVGRVRRSNEDAYVVTDRVFAVADGMGGHLAGEVASAMAADVLRRLDGAVSTDDAVQAVIGANLAILQRSRSDASHRGMGTTLSGLAVVRGDTDDRLAVLNVGDSRTYRLRGGKLEQVSIDHSYVQELVSAGHISADEARQHPQRNIVTRALGIEPAVGIDVWTLPIVRGDRYLVCSDGLVDEITDDLLLDVLCDHADPQRAADELVRRANAAGGRDNTTVVVVDVVDGLDPAQVSDAEDLRNYITVRGSDDQLDDSDETGELDDQETDDDFDADFDNRINPPADLTAAVLRHGRDPSGAYRPAGDDADDTPTTAARRRLMRERANMRFIIGGAAVAVIAILLVVLTAVFSDDPKSSPTPTVTFVDESTVPTDATGAGAPDTISPMDETGPATPANEN